MRIRKAKVNAIIMLNSHGRDSEARVESVISVKAGCTKSDNYKVLWISAGDVDGQLPRPIEVGACKGSD